MRFLVFFLPGLSAIAMAFWAYSENNETRAAVRHAEHLESRIEIQREKLTILRAEWAYLNRPDRLSDLVDMNFGRLQLIPLSPNQFARVEGIPYPYPAIPLAKEEEQ